MCEHTKKIRSSQDSISTGSYSELRKTRFFPVSIVKTKKILWIIKYFEWLILGYHTPSFLLMGLYKVNKDKNEKIANQINDSLIELRNPIARKEIPENENPNKV